MSEYKGVAVYCEVAGGKLAPIATEGLGIGRKLADTLGQQLSAVLAGRGAPKVLATLVFRRCRALVPAATGCNVITASGPEPDGPACRPNENPPKIT